MIDMQVRAEDGEIEAHGTQGVAWTESLTLLDQVKFPFLTSLLPYADTVFNERQAARLRREVADPVAREVLGEAVAVEIEERCRQVEDGIHLYLWFVGD